MEDLIKKYENHQIDEKTQQELNKPLKDKTGFNEGHQEFLKNLMEKLESGELDTHQPATLYNHEVYDQLSEEEQEQTDLAAVNLMSLIRQIQSLWQLDQSPSFQIQNLVEAVFEKKSKFEEKHGDVYVI